MLELVEFVRAKRFENESLELLPLFYKASVSDLSDKSIEDEWKPRWMKLVRPEKGDDVEEWAAAVREIRGVNGPNFEQFGKSEVKYREDIVKQIFKLAPSDLLYDTSKISGRERICEELAGKFRPHFGTSAQVLGLFGVGGLGKSTMAFALLNHFNYEFLGRVCYVEIKDRAKALERQQLVMRRLLGLDVGFFPGNECHVSQGWKLLQSRMKEYPVFLVIDNVEPDEVSKGEACNYLNIEYHPGSKIMVISRSPDVVEDLLEEPEQEQDGELQRELKEPRYSYKMPCLTREEAAEVFLQKGAPRKDYGSLTMDQRSVVESCIEEARFSYHCVRGEKTSYQNKAGHYHPMALGALGVFVHEKCKDLAQAPDILSWKSYLHKYGKLKSSRESYTRLFDILGLQFNTLDKMTKLMFLDISLYASKALETPMLSNSPLEDLKAWLVSVYEEPIEVVEPKIFDLKRFAMIKIENEEIIIHDLYKEYAVWYLEQANGEELFGVWCVGKPEDPDSSLPRELRESPRGGCWPHLKRIRLQYVSCGRFLERRFPEWRNIEVLQIVGCDWLTTMNLEGLIWLRHLELKDLWKLKTLTITRYRSGSCSTRNISRVTHPESRRDSLLPPLQFVVIDGLSSLECLPSFSPFTTLKCLKIGFCEGLTQPPSVLHCSSLQRMLLVWYPKQDTLPILDGLTALQDLTIICCNILSYQGRALKLEDLSSSSTLGALGLRNVPVEDRTHLGNAIRLEYIVLGVMDHETSWAPLFHLARSSLQAITVWRCYTDSVHSSFLQKQKANPTHCLDSLIKFKPREWEAQPRRKRVVSLTPPWSRIPNVQYQNQPPSGPTRTLGSTSTDEIPHCMVEVKLSLKKSIKSVFHDLEIDLKQENMMVCVNQNNIIVTGIIPQNDFDEKNVLYIVHRHDSGAKIISFRFNSFIF